jgi:hypothetical protein
MVLLHKVNQVISIIRLSCCNQRLLRWLWCLSLRTHFLGTIADDSHPEIRNYCPVSVNAAQKNGWATP